MKTCRYLCANVRWFSPAGELLSPVNPRNGRIKLKWRAFSLSFEQKHSM